MLPAIEAGVAHEAVKMALEEEDIDDDDVPILQQVLFEATLVRLSLHLANYSDYWYHTASRYYSIRTFNQ